MTYFCIDEKPKNYIEVKSIFKNRVNIILYEIYSSP